MKKSNKCGQYTCNDYRIEMILLGLQKRLSTKGLTSQEKESLIEEIAKVEKQMGID